MPVNLLKLIVSPKIIFGFALLWLSINVYAQQREDYLRVGIDLTYPPYAYWDKNIASGFDPDLMRLLAKEMGKTAEFKDTRIENIIMGLNAHHYDVVASALYVNQKRAKQLDYIPYLQTGGVLMVRANDEFNPQSLDDLCGKSISSMKGAAWIDKVNQVSQQYCLPNGFKPIVVKEYPSAPEATQALLSKAVEVQYEDAAVAQMVINASGNSIKITNQKLLAPVLIGLGVYKDNTVLEQQIIELIKKLKISGEYDALLDRYHLEYPSPELLLANQNYLVTDINGNLKTTSKTASIVHFDWSYLAQQLINPDFWLATWTVIKLSTLAWVMAIIFGLLLALANCSKKLLLHYSTEGYIWLFRSLPLLVLLIFVYNIPQFWPASSFILANSFIAGLISLVLSESAYIAEIHRGALQAIPLGQTEAGKALGFRFWGIQRKIIIPQAVRIALPALTNQYITIIKLTSIVSVISLTEILLTGQQLYTRNFLVMETLFVVAFYYIIVVTIVSWGLKSLEKKLDVRTRPIIENRSLEVPQTVLVKPILNPLHPNSTYALSLIGLSKKYAATTVLDNINLNVKWGEVISIIGPSGSGKTTLIRSINGLEPIDSGQIEFEGSLFLDAGTKIAHRTSYYQKIIRLGMVFQDYQLFPHLTVLENLLLAPQYHHQSKTESKINALILLAKVDMQQHAFKYPHQLSGGQQQRVAIARALIMQPSIMLFDEPTSALDPELVKEVLKVMEDLAKDGMTMLIVTHEISFAMNISNRIAFMESGKIIKIAPPQDLWASNDSRIHSFIHSNNNYSFYSI